MLETDQFGQSMNEQDIKRGLLELNPDIHFDMGAALNLLHPQIDDRQGVFYKGRHICAMDRGTIPEFTIWSLKKKAHTVKPENVRIGEGWAPSLTDPGMVIVVRPARHRIIKVGWRDTFERLIRAQVPGITRESLSVKFAVPIKFFTGEIETIEAA